MQLQLLMLIIFILINSFTSANEVFTRSQLRGLHQRHMIKMLDDQIQKVVESVVASAQNNETSYTHRYLWRNENENERFYFPDVLHKFEDKTIIDRLQNNLVDCNITITEPRCCYPDDCAKHYQGSKIMCKKIYILW
jgi:hypothetical protein